MLVRSKYSWAHSPICGGAAGVPRLMDTQKSVALSLDVRSMTIGYRIRLLCHPMFD